MARVPQVSRTFTSLEVTCRCVNIEKECFEEHKFIVKKPTNDYAKLLRACKRQAKPPIDPIKVLDKSKIKVIYSMLAEDFLDHAVQGFCTKEDKKRRQEQKEKEKENEETN